MLIKKIKRCIEKLTLKSCDYNTIRAALSKCYIRGAGLEIGALHFPLPLSKGALAHKVDLFTREENIKKYPELDPSKIVEPDYIDDGFVLSTIPKSTQDFLVANHVLEHAANPIQALMNWASVLKPNGVLFVSVPIAKECFDRGRPLTTLQHLIDDFNLCNGGESAALSERNKEHLVEWVNISEPNIFKERCIDYVKPSSSEFKKRIDEVDKVYCEMHFHTFSVGSFNDLMSFFSTEIDKSFKVEVIEKNLGEVISILRKLA